MPQFEPYARDALRLVGARPGARVLDVACGPGTLALLAAAEAAQVTAIDFAPEMIAELRRRAAEMGLENVVARLGDGQALELDDGAFDAAFSMFGLMFFPDRVRGLREIRRTLVPGGRVAISSWLPLHEEVPLLGVVLAALRERVPDLPVGGPRPPLGTAEELRAELEAAGFHAAAVHRIDHGAEYPDAATFSAMTRRTFAPLAMLRREIGDDALRPIAQEIDARVAEIAGEGPVRVTMPAWIGVATA